MGDFDTARARRTERRRALSRFLSRALAEFDVTQAELAAVTGTSPAVVQRWCDRERREQLGVADLPVLPKEVASLVLKWAAAWHGLDVTEHAQPQDAGDHLQLLHRVLRESGEAQACYAAALADGTIDDVEARELARQVSDAIDAYVSLGNALQRRLYGCSEAM